MTRVLPADRRPAFKAVVVLVVALAVAGLVAAALMAKPAAALGTLITVNTTADENNTDGDCSLREAVISANTESVTDACEPGSGSDGISVPAGTYTLTLAGANEDLALTGDLDLADSDGVLIRGAGAGATIIDAGGTPGGAAGIDRVFHVTTSGTASFSGVTVKGGTTAIGGGILNDGTLTLTDSTVSDNHAADFGGGIFNSSSGTLTLDDSTVSGNQANGPNAASNRGGGIHNLGGILTLDSSTVSGNHAGTIGGGIYSDTGISATKTTITNSTISGNTTGGAGGGIFNFSGLTSIEHSTISGNTAGSGSGVYSRDLDPGSTQTEMLSSIVSANPGTDADFVSGSTNSFVSGGSNLIGDGNSAAAFNQPNDRANVAAPGLGPLANNGSSTRTHALLFGSQAIDTGPSSCPASDQRGQTRPKDGNGDATATCDIGAFELQAALPPPPNTRPTITPLSPKPGARTFDATPLIRAKVTDLQTNLTKANLKLFVDNKRKTGFLYNPGTDLLSFTSPKLRARGHTVRVTATDGEGLSATRTWGFRVIERGR